MKCAQNSILHNITIASPCSASWDSMQGDEVSRFCGDCKLNVYNISAMTSDEAEKLIVEREGRLCLRIYQRADGTVLTKDCPVGLAARIKSYTLRGCAAAAAVVSVLAAFLINRTISANQVSSQIENQCNKLYVKMGGGPYAVKGEYSHSMGGASARGAEFMGSVAPSRINDVHPRPNSQ